MLAGRGGEGCRQRREEGAAGRPVSTKSQSHARLTSSIQLDGSANYISLESERG